MLKRRVLQVTDCWALPIATIFGDMFFIWQKCWAELRAEREKLRSNGMVWLCKKRYEERGCISHAFAVCAAQCSAAMLFLTHYV
jgi:hypothetical protein